MILFLQTTCEWGLVSVMARYAPLDDLECLAKMIRFVVNIPSVCGNLLNGTSLVSHRVFFHPTLCQPNKFYISKISPPPPGTSRINILYINVYIYVVNSHTVVVSLLNPHLFQRYSMHQTSFNPTLVQPLRIRPPCLKKDRCIHGSLSSLKLTVHT